MHACMHATRSRRPVSVLLDCWLLHGIGWLHCMSAFVSLAAATVASTPSWTQVKSPAPPTKLARSNMWHAARSAFTFGPGLHVRSRHSYLGRRVFTHTPCGRHMRHRFILTLFSFVSVSRDTVQIRTQRVCPLLVVHFILSAMKTHGWNIIQYTYYSMSVLYTWELSDKHRFHVAFGGQTY
jgi:hypothetical protein